MAFSVTAKISAPFLVLTALAFLVHPSTSVEVHRKLSGWSSGGATWYGGPTGAGSDGNTRSRKMSYDILIVVVAVNIYGHLLKHCF